MRPGDGCENISEMKVTWAHVMNDGAVSKLRRGGAHQQYPEFQSLKDNVVTAEAGMDDVLIRDSDESTLMEIRSWLEEHAKRKYKMFGRFGWTDQKLSIHREFVGLLFKFTDPNAAFFFKMRFYSGF